MTESRRRPTLAKATIPRSVATWLGLAVCLAIGSAGCRTTPTDAAPDRKHLLSASAGIQGEGSVVQTDFQREADTGQRFGLHLAHARACEVQGNDEAAVAAYQQAIEAGESPVRHRGPKIAADQKSLAHRRLANALARLGRFGQAEVHYQAALKLNPNDPRVWNDSGYSDHIQGRFPEAERALRTAARLDPTNAQIRTNLGLTLAAAGKTDAALESLSAAGGPAVGHANLGYILASTGHAEAAREHYRLALQLQPKLDAARVALAKLDADSARTRQVAAVPDRGVARVSAPAAEVPRPLPVARNPSGPPQRGSFWRVRIRRRDRSGPRPDP